MIGAGEPDMEAIKRVALALALAAAAGIDWTGCAARQEARVEGDEHLLTDAGFHSVPADSPERASALARLRPDTVTEVRRGDRTFYVYPDPHGCHCLYVGSSDENDEYRKLLYQKGHPQPGAVPWNEGELNNGSVNWESFGAWPWWD
jgi:hypothetical protein